MTRDMTQVKAATVISIFQDKTHGQKKSEGGIKLICIHLS